MHNVPRTTLPRTKEQGEKEAQRIKKYRELEQNIRQRVEANKQSAIGQTNNGTENSQPADYSNDRKSVESTIRSELVFTVPLLIEFPKCYWIWKYRVWMLQQATEKLLVTNARVVWEEELVLVQKMLHKDCRNFHAWGYRRHVVSQLENPILNGKSMVESEFVYTTMMTLTDLSNFSAWHNRSQLIPRLLNERNADAGARKRFLDEGEFSSCRLNLRQIFVWLITSMSHVERENVHEALNLGPDDQSLWYYHQYLVNAIIGASGQGPIVRDLSLEERHNYLQDEIAFIQDLLEDYLDVKWIYEALVECTLAAKKLSAHELQQTKRYPLAEWIRKLQELDKKRKGRWDDLEMYIQVHY
ncbi:hypothetical protein QQS21_003876 [Conoideocrella luteorostrata]|uniref:Geranylgeranyl transferase type-2 subunit alpha n=1 Tax=Conoideocrella luteorostrata TaxID=1105319 RepID=A0AAJ0G092_9HYPO|nr:hypothetical protein QQS21_003876 [Conoideocrella luteorostrata]